MKPDPETQRQAKGATKRSGAFFWGLSLGLLATLAFLLLGDLGGELVPGFSTGGGNSVAGGNERKPAPATVLLSTVLPPQYQVFVNGRAVSAQTTEDGMRIAVDSGPANVEVRGERGPVWSTRLVLQAGTVDTLQPDVGGDIVVEVKRQGPEGPLYLDGALTGTAPGTVTGVAPGWHMVSIRRQGRTLFEDACSVVSGEVTVVHVPPVPPRGKGRLLVRSRTLTEQGIRRDKGDPVFIDGRNRGVTPLDATLSAGFHGVRVQRDGAQPIVRVLYVEAGRSRYMDAEFGGEPPLTVRVSPPLDACEGSPVAIPVWIAAAGNQTVSLARGQIHVVRPGQSEPVSVPLVASGTDPHVWVALLPGELSKRSPLTGYAECRDQEGRTGTSEMFRLDLRQERAALEPS